MRGVFDLRQLAHSPERELNNGEWTPHAEVAERAEIIASAFGALEQPRDFGERPLLAVHDGAYLSFLKEAHALWREAGRPGDAIGYTFPIVRRRQTALRRIDALVGQYSFDAATPIAAGTWDAAYASAQSALTAQSLVQAGERSAFALCRPPGHHAGADYCGGYCYLNNAAIAAEAAIAAGARRVAILDIDYHHGNGTQDIFWRRSDVLFCSLHADPATDYPYYWGHADETGEDEGEGSTLNIPLQRGATIDDYRPALARALDRIASFAPDRLVISFGADTWEGDPVGAFALKSDDFAILASDIAGCGSPTIIVMEGGYAVDALGKNVANFLSCF